RRRHTRFSRDWSSDVCSSDLPEGATVRTETALELLERVKRYNLNWVRAGHQRGDNTNNVSATISIRDNEWDEVGEWMWENKDSYNGISVLPYSGHTYQQAPFEDITEEQYDNLVGKLTAIDLRNVVEANDNTSLQSEAACAGNQCEVVF